MRNSIRVGLVAAVATVALAASGSALAALNPSLAVAGPSFPTKVGPVSITLKTLNADDAVGKISVFAPVGYQLQPGTAGSKVGSVTAIALLGDQNNQAVTLKGNLTALDPNDASVGNASASCDNTVHSLVWMMKLSGAGQTFDIPVFVDQTSGSEASFSSFRIVMCFKAPDVPVGTANRSTAGARFIEVGISSNQIISPTVRGEYKWRSMWTAFAPKTGSLAPTGSREAQALVRLPTTMSLKGRRTFVLFKGKLVSAVRLSGRLTENGTGIPAIRISLQAGRTKSSLTRLDVVGTRRDGSFVKTLRLKNPKSFMAEVTIPLRSLRFSGCKATFGTTVQCAALSVAGTHVLSNVVRVK